ncbi:SMP-30/gluconolactonase/LRE family protein [Bordetella holmesii]|uniref:SMP-30/Gluconolaconase/LRE-like region n=2 Tax=Bordetella holmesii TaxID=35814 RepID=A0A158M0A8_9BORD|nr:SMP-30/gluconolactonase/LRE family protein [Bordetella holmesii]AHV92552.1 SMP-30/Gluconolaconase/LRE-like region family protein [Bordetella holmesii ATCC 51541]AIT25252.1 SMP-30/Gluconolaconase/LRE-like region family protein [Bordetella holmesii 44057]EWM45816.1 SMP-30/Gluconolaconase/LRE-like region family protein [Bordetella holmesii 70147]EWM48836.1 SMP-30/Gluconolaconase/LRE-like region family protein [Bordetella holmesii 41130]EWM49946.1 SMP-30/Gluconolaconase/LRE-like region family p
MQIDRIGTTRAALGECPVWDEAGQRIWMADCRAGRVLCIDPASGASRQWQLPAPIGSFALNGDDQLVVALKDAFALFDLRDEHLQIVARLGVSHPNLRLNDGVAMPDGSFVAGTMHIYRKEDEPPLGGLYRLDTRGRLTLLAGELGVVNGPGPDPLGRHFYVCDSAQRTVFRFRMAADGTLAAREVFVDTDALGSAPDGCCFDAEGGLWTALVHAGAIARFDQQGRLDVRIDLPVRHPASLCFGGADLTDIYVTSISDSGRLAADGPMDGALLRVRGSGARGAPRSRSRICL